MSALGDGFDAVRLALKTVPGVRAYVLGERAIDPPATIVAPPQVQWNAMGSDPTGATFEVALVVAMNERAATQLIALLPRVVAALEKVPSGAVISAAAGTYPAAPKDLPAYLITVEVGLL